MGSFYAAVRPASSGDVVQIPCRDKGVLVGGHGDGLEGKEAAAYPLPESSTFIPESPFLQKLEETLREVTYRQYPSVRSQERSHSHTEHHLFLALVPAG